MVRSLPLLFSLLILTVAGDVRLSAQGQDTIRVCTYNLDGFSGADTDLTSNIYAVLEQIRPNILVIQSLELTEDLSSYPLFRSSVAAALSVPLSGFSFFAPDDESMVAILYDREKLEFLPDPGTIPTDPAVHAWMYFVVKASGDTVVVMTGEWNDGDGEEDHAVRRETAQEVREVLETLAGNAGESTHVIMAGTLNLRSSQSDAWEILTGADTSSIRLFDPVDRPGDWTDSPDFSSLHTSSTRITVTGEDTTGGLRDRFDQILLGGSLLPHVLPGSHTVYGNNGELFGRAITDESNDAVMPAFSLSLWRIGTHLPVYVDLVFGGTSSSERMRPAPEALDLSVRSTTSTPPPCR